LQSGAPVLPLPLLHVKQIEVSVPHDPHLIEQGLQIFVRGSAEYPSMQSQFGGIPDLYRSVEGAQERQIEVEEIAK
jgi:hypothetical protein